MGILSKFLENAPDDGLVLQNSLNLDDLETLVVEGAVENVISNQEQSEQG